METDEPKPGSGRGRALRLATAAALGVMLLAAAPASAWKPSDAPGPSLWEVVDEVREAVGDGHEALVAICHQSSSALCVCADDPNNCSPGCDGSLASDSLDACLELVYDKTCGDAIWCPKAPNPPAAYVDLPGDDGPN